MNNSILWLWLNEKVALSRQKQLVLLEGLKNIENIYNAGLSDYTSFDILNEGELNLLCTKNADEMCAEYEMFKKRGIFLLTIDSEDYPDLLREISDPPTVLYCRGKHINLNSRLCISVVGTRKATMYGKGVAHNISKSLASQGVIIVSGMAMGIDTKAHEGAMFAKAPTVAVIGCGVDIAYPKSNTALMREIEKTGMIISEYPLGSLPARFHFPERNRIISGISNGTLVVEADIKSGSLITAKSAYEQNRDVFAVPGNINSVYSKGTNYLLKDGAHLVTCDEDILSVYRFDYADRLMNLPFETAEEADSVSDEEALPDNPEDRIYRILSDTPVHVDTICNLTHLDVGCVNSTLLLMELRGKALKLPGGFYQRP